MQAIAQSAARSPAASPAREAGAPAGRAAAPGRRAWPGRGQRGASTIMFVFTLFWTMVILFVFIQLALIGYTWQVTGYATYAAARSRIVGKLGNGSYKDVAEQVMEGALPESWGSTWGVQELPFGMGVLMLYHKQVLGVRVPVFGRAEVPYSKLNPMDPAYDVWDKGDNN